MLCRYTKDKPSLPSNFFMSDRITESIVGCLLGTMVGDALGLPYEGLSGKRIQQLV